MDDIGSRIEEVSLLLRFYPFGNDLKMQVLCNRQNGFHERSIIGIRR